MVGQGEAQQIIRFFTSSQAATAHESDSTLHGGWIVGFRMMTLVIDALQVGSQPGPSKHQAFE